MQPMDDRIVLNQQIQTCLKLPASPEPPHSQNRCQSEDEEDMIGFSLGLGVIFRKIIFNLSGARFVRKQFLLSFPFSRIPVWDWYFQEGLQHCQNVYQEMGPPSNFFSM
ncbi:uncharacterized protein LOC122091844 isoform X2 [Macadamia integrifolia]|uniref:uncharacterized protein LOC122091844 isoform X2 n=1 Tax=Macadamia integrifolia TaxID=60698 RepID=UPI001C4EA70D|nr:uncharacterized protein LOC122091844 isoform X2 [Macadamia integrifolia]